MDWRETDLTLESVFGGDHDSWLLLRDADEYRRRHAPRDIYMDLFGVDRDGSMQIVWGHELGRPEIITRPDDGDDDLLVTLFYHLFGEVPGWYRQMFGYDPFASAICGGQECDSCGKRLHLLNSDYGICHDCDVALEDRLGQRAEVPILS